MNRNEALLEKLSSWRPAEGRQSLQVAGDATGWAVALTVDRADQLGCLVWELGLRKNARATENAEELDGWARRVADRATGLLESLKVVEVDATRGEALLRSESPANGGDTLRYYEVLLNGAGSVNLRRYSAPRIGPGKREQIAFVLTHEALAKLAADLTDAA
ncbi:MAG TPA: hypothetical protein VKE94_05375 [Gemmataceae bacterium]|nr:hypothetical protein [Gemmataceae bacterium]